MIRWYGVASREYCYVEPVTMDGQGPLEYARYFVFARAKSPQRAKVIALRWFRRHEHGWKRDMGDYGSYGDNPFTGMTAEPVLSLDEMLHDPSRPEMFDGTDMVLPHTY